MKAGPLAIEPTCFVKNMFIFIIFDYVCRFVGECTHEFRCSLRQEACDSPGVGDTGGVSYSVWVFGNQTRVLYNTSVHPSLLSHLWSLCMVGVALDFKSRPYISWQVHYISDLNFFLFQSG